MSEDKARRDTFVCPKCGQVIEYLHGGTEPFVAIMNQSGTRHIGVCKDCYETHGVEGGWVFDTCQECGEITWYDYDGDIVDGDNERGDACDWSEVQGFPVCPTCLENEYITCEHCNEYVHHCDASVVIVSTSRGRVDRQYWCADCVEDGAVECECCDELVPIGESRSDNNGTTVCDRCYEDSYCTCDNCGNIIRCDDSYEHDGEAYCQTCHEDMNGRGIMDYHSSVKTVLHRYEKDAELNLGIGSSMFFGLEMECDDPEENAGLSDVAEGLNGLINSGPNVYDLMHIEHDGSLSHGFEVVWQPMTMGFLWTSGHKLFVKAARHLVQHGMRADKTSTCGAHIHATRSAMGNEEEQLSILDKLTYIVHKFDEDMLSFCRRSYGGLERWAKLNSSMKGSIMDTRKLDNDLKDESVSIENAKYVRRHQDGDRYTFFNQSTRGRRTVEWRAPKGTLNPQTIMANFEFYYGLIKFCARVSWKELRDLTFKQITLQILDIVQTDKRKVMEDDTVTTHLGAYLNKRGLI